MTDRRAPPSASPARQSLDLQRSPPSFTLPNESFSLSAKARPRGWLPIAALVVAWYGCSVVAIVTAKTVLNAAHCPATLCAVEFALAALGSRFLQGGTGGVAPLGKEARLVRALAVCYTMGFLLTNAAFNFAAPAFIETFKSAEPLSTVALAAAALGERERPLTLLALLPVVGGVALASHGSAAFSAAGVALALGSNLGFSARAVCAKALYRDHPGSRAATSDACLFYHVSLTGLLLLLPVALLSDARVLAAALAAAPPAAAARLVLTLAANGAAHALYNGVSFAMLAQVRRLGGSALHRSERRRARVLRAS